MTIACSARGCKETAPDLDVVKTNGWLVVDGDKAKTIWCLTHRMLIPTWHNPIRLGEMENLLNGE